MERENRKQNNPLQTQNFKTFSNVTNLDAAQVVKLEQTFQSNQNSILFLNSSASQRVGNILQRLKIQKVQKRKP